MAKKRTTGGPRPRRTTAADIERRQQYKSRAQIAEERRRYLVIGIGALVAISVLILVYAVFNDQYLRPRQAITTINGTAISTRKFEDRVRFIRWTTGQQVRNLYVQVGGDLDTLQQIAGQQISNLQRPLILGGQVLDEMEEEIVMEQAAREMGIELDEAAVDREVEEFFAEGYGLTLPDADTPTPSPEPTITLTPLVSPTPRPSSTPTSAPTAEPTAEDATPGPTATATATLEPTATFTPMPTLASDEIVATVAQAEDDYFDAATGAVDISRRVVRDVFYYQALRNRMIEELGKDVPAEELQVNSRHILIPFNPDLPVGQAPPPTEEERAAAEARANEVLEALQNGELFADLASAMSADTGSAAQGGELGWSSPDGFVENFRDAVLNAEIGAIVGPIETEFGFHIIQVHAREVRALSPSELSQRRSQAYQEWIDEQMLNADISRRGDWLDRVPEDPSFNNLLGDILGAG